MYIKTGMTISIILDKKQTKYNTSTLEMLGCAEIIAAILCFIFMMQWRRRSTTPLMIDWPFIGMLPEVLYHLRESHDFATVLLKRQGGTGEFRGPWFTNMDYLVTSDPMNVHHAMSKNFGNYIKGPVFREIFEAFGDGIFTADSESWKSNRALLHSLFKNKNFELFLEKTIRKKLKNSLFPVLDHVEKQGIEVDLQDVFNRFNFDIICSLILGSDPQCLSIEFPEVKSEKAFNEAEELIFYRHTMPRSIWKIQKWLRVGPEKKMAEACEVFDQFLHECIASKRKELSTCTKGTILYLFIYFSVYLS